MQSSKTHSDVVHCCMCASLGMVLIQGTYWKYVVLLLEIIIILLICYVSE